MVKQGDTLSAIAKKHKINPEKIWNHSKNAKLKEKRGSRDVLLPEDKLEIPAPEEKDEGLKLECINRFYIDAEHGEVKIAFWKYDKPRESLQYTPFFEESGIANICSKLDANAIASHEIDHDEKHGKITLEPEEDSELDIEEYSLRIGWLDPLDYLSGVQARLRNLGYFFDVHKWFPFESSRKPYSEDEADELTKNAIAVFQIENGIEPTGNYNEETKSKLREVHGG